MYEVVLSLNRPANQIANFASALAKFITGFGWTRSRYVIPTSLPRVEAAKEPFKIVK